MATIQPSLNLTPEFLEKESGVTEKVQPQTTSFGWTARLAAGAGAVATVLGLSALAYSYFSGPSPSTTLALSHHNGLTHGESALPALSLEAADVLGQCLWTNKTYHQQREVMFKPEKFLGVCSAKPQLQVKVPKPQPVKVLSAANSPLLQCSFKDKMEFNANCINNATVVDSSSPSNNAKGINRWEALSTLSGGVLGYFISQRNVFGQTSLPPMNDRGRIAFQAKLFDTCKLWNHLHRLSERMNAAGSLIDHKEFGGSLARLMRDTYSKVATDKRYLGQTAGPEFIRLVNEGGGAAQLTDEKALQIWNHIKDFINRDMAGVGHQFYNTVYRSADSLERRIGSFVIATAQTALVAALACLGLYSADYYLQ